MRSWAIVYLLLMPLLLTGCGWKDRPGKKQSNSLSSAQPSNSIDSLSSVAKSSPIAHESNFFTIDPKSYEATADQARQKATEKAKLWREDATFYHLSVRIPAGYGLEQSTEVYTFGSATEVYDWWTMTISAKTGKTVRAVIPKEDYLGTDFQPIPLEYWRMNMVEALQLADSNGGSIYRANHKNATVTATLAVGNPNNYLWWTIEYTAEEVEPFKLIINPASKEIFRTDGLPIQASQSAVPVEAHEQPEMIEE